MAGSTSGEVFRVHTAGESHGPTITAIVDGCPAGIELSEADIQPDLDRRAPGQSRFTTQRKEPDLVEIHSGVHEGLTTGAPITLLIPSKDSRSGAYDHMQYLYRPNHGDFTFDTKYGFRDHKGGGRASARTTAAATAAGAIAKLVVPDVTFTAYVKSIRDIEANIPDEVTHEMVEASTLRCPDPDATSQMEVLIQDVQRMGESVGGVIELRIAGIPGGLGEPVFDKFDADLAKAMIGIPAVKAIEFGRGFEATKLLGSEHNDEFYAEDGVIRTRTNNSGGIQAGITNGEDVVLRLGFKPTATITKEQQTVTQQGEPTSFRGFGRHDVCVLPRAVPIVEAMAALVTADHFLRQRHARI